MTAFAPHGEKQDRALFSTAPLTVVATGIQWGKTTIGAVWLKMMMHKHTEPDDNFIMTSPTFPILEQSTLPPFLRLMEGYGRHDKKNNSFKMHGGGTCWFRTGKDPDSIVGIPKVRAILGDEAGKYSLYFWENIQGRADPNNAPIMLVTSPYALNWLYKEIIRPKLRNKGARPDVELIQAKSIENPHFSAERYNARKLTMDPRRFNMMYGGDWLKASGVVYDCFDEEESQCDPIALPAGTVFRGGIDWGFTEPFVFKIRAITQEGLHYGVSEFYKSGLIIDQICEAVIQRVRLYGVDIIYAPPDRPENIAALQRAIADAKVKCAVVTADNSKRIGIDRHYELLKTRRLKYFRGMNPHTLDEIETYHYPEPVELEADDKAKDMLPVEQHDHAMDADRYISISTWNAASARTPHVPGEQKQEDQFERLARLKRRPRAGNSESWS